MTFDPYQRLVKDEMSTEVISIVSTAPLITALDLMEKKSVTALPVVDQDNRCIGVISTTDVACAARATAIQLQQLADAGEEDRPGLVRDLVSNGMVHQSVHAAMRYKLKCVHQETPIVKAGGKMLLSRFHHLPVVDEERRLVGIISTLDLLAAFVKGKTDQADDDSQDDANLNDTTC